MFAQLACGRTEMEAAQTRVVSRQRGVQCRAARKNGSYLPEAPVQVPHPLNLRLFFLRWDALFNLLSGMPAANQNCHAAQAALW